MNANRTRGKPGPLTKAGRKEEDARQFDQLRSVGVKVTPNILLLGSEERMRLFKKAEKMQENGAKLGEVMAASTAIAREMLQAREEKRANKSTQKREVVRWHNARHLVEQKGMPPIQAAAKAGLGDKAAIRFINYQKVRNSKERVAWMRAKSLLVRRQRFSPLEAANEAGLQGEAKKRFLRIYGKHMLGKHMVSKR